MLDFFSDEYEDSRKLERIKTSVLKPSRDRAERKARINITSIPSALALVCVVALSSVFSAFWHV